MTEPRGSTEMPKSASKAAALLCLFVVTLLLGGCSQQSEPAKTLQIGDPLLANLVTVDASSLPDVPLLQSWLVTHQVPRYLPFEPTDIGRIDFKLGSRSPLWVQFHTWSGSHELEPPATLRVSALRWNLIARTDRNEPLEATVESEPELKLQIAGPCGNRGCPYEFAPPERAIDWLSFSLDRGMFPELTADWLHPGGELKIAVVLAVWLTQPDTAGPGADRADYLSATFQLASGGTSLLVTQER